MARYMLTGIDNEQWRRFKASCDLQGITIKEALLSFINTRDEVFRAQHNYHKTHHPHPKKGGEKK
ncbi:hypothetical protein ES703_103190 [subsurface metagenome]